ncbi:MAG: hypothetical protein WBD28_07440, partial [Candidatus Zixiibacteriota bacterium]
MIEKEKPEVHGLTHEHKAKLIRTGRLVGEAVTECLTTCAIKYGDSGIRDDFGGSFSADLTDAIGPGYKCVNVQLAGWYVDFRSKDHNINTISIRFKDIDYNSATGAVRWKVHGYYQDKNYDDDYTW